MPHGTGFLNAGLNAAVNSSPIGQIAQLSGWSGIHIANPNACDHLCDWSYDIGGYTHTAAMLAARAGAAVEEGAAASGEATAAEAGAAWTGVSAADDILPTPQVSDSKLQSLVDNLYKETTDPNLVGNGTTMDAIRSESETGAATAGLMHTVKGQETLQG